MQSKVKLFGHSVHPMLVSFPIAFFTGTLLCAIVYATTGNIFWFKVELVANCAGLVMAIAATLPGLIDWLIIPTATDAKMTGFRHMVANAFSVGLFGANAAVNYTFLHNAHPPIQIGVLLSSFGFLIMLYAGFQGWTLVQTHHIGIDISSKEEVGETDETKPGGNIFTGLRKSEH